MDTQETAPEAPKPEQAQRLILEDRGPWVFALYWYSFTYRMGNEPPRPAMRLFGLSATLRDVFLSNERTASLSRRFDARARMLMAVCFLPAVLCVAAFIVLGTLSGYETQIMREQAPTLGALLVALAFLTLILMIIFTKNLYLAFTGLFAAFNETAGQAHDRTAPPDAPASADEESKPSAVEPPATDVPSAPC